jgi:VanZ family protein
LRVALAIYVLLDVVVSLVPMVGVGVGHWDKVGHFFAYAGMAFLSMLSFQSRRARAAALVGAVALGALLEYGQSYVPGRQMSLADGIVNAFGVLSGALLFHCRRVWTRSQRR